MTTQQQRFSKERAYKQAVAWIADGPASADADANLIEEVRRHHVVLLVADIFDKEVKYVARDVIAFRQSGDLYE